MDDVVRDLGVLSEPVRIRLLSLLEREELGVGELCRVVQLPQSTVSRHLKALQIAGWLRRRAEGTSGYFRIDEAAMDGPRRALWDLVRSSFVGTLQAAEDEVRFAATLAARAGEGSFFERMHADWDRLRNELFGDAFLAAALVGLLPGEWVVGDVGCGTGPALPLLAGAVRRVVGVDKEPRMLEAAEQRVAGFDNVELRLGGLDALPIETGELDAAICVLVLHHVQDLRGAFAEIRRALKPGGRLVVVDMVAHDRHDWRQAMGHHHLGFDAEALARIALEAGLRSDGSRLLPPAPEAQGPPLFVWRASRA